MQPIIAKARKTNDRRWSRVAATRDLPTIAFFRAGELLRRSVPVPGILATHQPGAIMDKSGRQFVARPDWGGLTPPYFPGPQKRFGNAMNSSIKAS